MKVLIFSGSHPRHFFIHKVFMSNEFDFDCSAVVMERESLIPEPPDGINENDKENFIRHFKERSEIEANVYGTPTAKEVFSDIPIHYCNSETLNSTSTEKFVKSFNPDITFIFGTDIIKDPVLSALSEIRINLHLGLSPWYRGSATLFWPFYYLEPNFAGVTFHQILPEADAGDILHQSVPELKQGDGIHDVGIRSVIQAAEDLKGLLRVYKKHGRWEFQSQKSTGKLFLTNDFRPEHLRVIYNLYDNNLVDDYLSGNIERKNPKLIQNPHLKEFNS